ncbi:hypothetical protein HPB49_018204 [Dermacentor silvarum]|uniref:Uncharacterized protein n=1 Tax=Dermacentor silvarum TaxID=543639 RepID=A0ACB8CZG3_DERSI|nr:hypothetical protein HPB49_018204 [Dermacentor silvarum]
MGGFYRPKRNYTCTGSLPDDAVLCNAFASQSPEVVNDLIDILPQSLREHPYEGLKEKFLTRTVPSECTRLQQLLTSEEVGDRRLSQCCTGCGSSWAKVTSTTTALCSNSFSCSTFLNLFASFLPPLMTL